MVRSVVIWLVLLVSYARADSIAMLPLDAEKRLEIYSQPVAAEIARALKAVNLDVVVVGAKMEVPDTAQLIVDGTLKAKGKEVTVAIRIRNPRDGTVLENVPPQTAPLANIDQAAASISAQVVPLVQKHLAELAKQKEVKPPPPPVEGKPPQPQTLLPKVVTATSSPPKSQSHPYIDLLRDAIGVELPTWARQNHREATVVTKEKLERKTAVKTIGAAQTDAGISFEVLNLWITKEDGIPMAEARVRVRIASAAEVKFERIVHTDTIIGEKGMTNEALAARAAREVLAIVVPHMRRAIGTWRR